jgi:hypothetical protein
MELHYSPSQWVVTSSAEEAVSNHINEVTKGERSLGYQFITVNNIWVTSKIN